MQKSLIVSAALFAIFAAGAANAGVLTQHGKQETTRVEVNLKGLNLRNPAQAEEAYRRLQEGAYNACASKADFDRKEQRRDSACARQALNTAVATLNRPSLNARHQSARPLTIASN